MKDWKATVSADLRFDQLASDEQIAATQQALNAHNIQTTVVDTGEEARDCVLSLIPEGAEVHLGVSATLDLIGVTEVIEQSGRYNAIRPQLRKMDRIKQNREWRKLASAPDVMLGSVHAVTEQGQVLVARAGAARSGHTLPAPAWSSGWSARRSSCRRWPMGCGAARSTRCRWKASACARRPAVART